MSNKSNKKTGKFAPKKGGAQMRNKRAVHQTAKRQAAPAVVKPAMPKDQKILIVLTALLCAFSIAFVSLGTVCLVDLFGGVKYGSIYDEIRIKDYVGKIKKDDYTGKEIDLSDQYIDPITMKDVEEYLLELRFTNRKMKASSQKLTPIGFGDDVAFYIVEVLNQSGKVVLKDKNAGEDYSQTESLTVGTAVFGEDFDQKLIEAALTPADTELRVRRNGTVALSDTVALTYYAYGVETFNSDYDKCVWKSDVLDQKTSARVELSSLPTAIGEGVVDNCLSINEPFFFVLENYDINGNGTQENYERAVKIEARVDFAVELETTKDITFKIPDDYYKAEDQSGHTAEEIALNGQTVTWRIIVTTMDDYDVPEANADFIKNTLKFTTELTGDAEVLQAYKDHTLKKLSEDREAYLKKQYIATALSQLVAPLYDAGLFGNSDVDKQKYPDTLIEDALQKARDEMQNLYYSSGYSAYYTFENFLIQYASSMAGTQVTSANVALSYFAEQFIAQELFLYYVLEKENIRITKDMVEDAYREYVDGLIENSGDPDLYNEAYWIEQYGEEGLRVKARREILVYRLVGEFLLENNTITYEKP